MVAQFSEMNRRESVRAGLVLDSVLNRVHQESRYYGAITGPQWSRWMADRTLQWSGLTPWTQVGKHAFGMEMFGSAAEYSARRFDQLPENFRTTLERFGMSAGDWDVIRSTPVYEPKRGAGFIRPRDVIARADETGSSVYREVGERYLEMVQELGKLATPEGSLGATTFLKGGSQPGTFVGETMRATAMFKSFPIAILVQHGGHIAREWQSGNRRGAAIYAASMMFSTTMLAAVGLQLAQIVKGREPLNMIDPKFWGAAMTKGGGMGLFGDFFFADHSRYGGGFAQHFLGGPVVGSLDKATKLTLGNAWELASGKDTKAGREAVDFLRSETPFGSLFYARAAWERIFLDQLQRAIDPDAQKAFARRAKYYEKNFDQSYWWKPGDLTP